jgi:hypothetical protein
MRSIRRPAAVLAVLLALGLPAQAKFGISKTKVILKRTRAPEIGLLGDTVKVDVTTRARSISDRSLDTVRQRVEEAVTGDRKRIVDRGADSVVHVVVEALDARVNDTTVYETQRVKVGEREEWDEKKKKTVKKDVYRDRSVPIPVHSARGHVIAHVEVEAPGGPRTADAGASYEDEFKGDVRIPEQASSESELEHYLVEQAARHAAAAVSFSADPVEALLATNGELKDGNRYAQGGLWRQALGAWVDMRPLKGDNEAARLHNIGVAHEALAYALPQETPEHRAELEKAREFYLKARDLDRGEKYFAEPIQRVETSLVYAGNAERYVEDQRKWHEARERRAAAPAATPTSAAPAAPNVPAVPPAPSAPRRRPAPSAPVARAPEQQDGLSSSAGLAIPLRNGSFESGLTPWTVSGKGAVSSEPRRGRVFQAAAGDAATTLVQPLGIDVQKAPAATLSLDYKVTSGEGRLRVLVAYEDATAHARTSTLEVTAGDAPGDWTSWTGDLVALRPRASRIKEVRIVAEGGTVLLDNVALTVR